MILVVKRRKMNTNYIKAEGLNQEKKWFVESQEKGTI
jgi:hypothetical protein